MKWCQHVAISWLTTNKRQEYLHSRLACTVHSLKYAEATKYATHQMLIWVNKLAVKKQITDWASTYRTTKEEEKNGKNFCCQRTKNVQKSLPQFSSSISVFSLLANQTGMMRMHRVSYALMLCVWCWANVFIFYIQTKWCGEEKNIIRNKQPQQQPIFWWMRQQQRAPISFVLIQLF